MPNFSSTQNFIFFAFLSSHGLINVLYCAYHAGFRYGYVRWDDEDSNNHNSHRGNLPDGSYDRNTVIYYCCREDGYATKGIYLPIDTPFVLFKVSQYHQCQFVYGANHPREEFFFWDSEDNSPDTDAKWHHPFVNIDSRKNLKVHYCYYPV